MNDIDDIIGRFRDYLPDAPAHPARVVMTRHPLTQLRRRGILVAASVTAVAAAALMTATFTRSDTTTASGYTNHLTPADRETAVSCIVHVPMLDGQSQDDATDAAVRVMAAKATTLQWTAAEIVKLDTSRVAVTVAGGGCDAIQAGLAVPFDVAIVHLRGMRVVSADQLRTTLAHLPRTSGRQAYRSYQVDSASTLPFTLGERADSIAGTGAPRRQVLTFPREYDVVALPMSADTAAPRRFAIYRYGANVLAAGTDVVGTTAVDATTLQIDLIPGAEQRVRAVSASARGRSELWLRFGNDLGQPEHGLVGNFDGRNFTVPDAPMLTRVVGGGNLVSTPVVDGPAASRERIPGTLVPLPSALRSDALAMLRPGVPRRLPNAMAAIDGRSPVFAFARDGSLTESTTVVTLRRDGRRNIVASCGQQVGRPALTICTDLSSQPFRTRIIGRSAPSVTSVVAATSAGTTITATPVSGWFAIAQPPSGTTITVIRALGADGVEIGHVEWPLSPDFIPLFA